MFFKAWKLTNVDEPQIPRDKHLYRASLDLDEWQVRLEFKDAKNTDRKETLIDLGEGYLGWSYLGSAQPENSQFWFRVLFIWTYQHCGSFIEESAKPG